MIPDLVSSRIASHCIPLPWRAKPTVEGQHDTLPGVPLLMLHLLVTE